MCIRDRLSELGIPVLNELSGVGGNLRDHPILPVTWTVKPGHVQDPEAPRSQVAVRYTATGSDIRNDVKLTFNSFAISADGHDADINKPVGVRLGVSLQLAESAGTLRLVSKDVGVQPELNYNYYSTDFDLMRGREGIRKGVALGESEPVSYTHLTLPTNREV